MHTPFRDLQELQKEASALARTLHPKKDKATLVTLSGELGAGKTTFVQELAKALGVTEAVTSPTFVLQKTYALTNQPFARLAHIDAYRLENTSELVHLGFDELMQDPQTLILFEWPERVIEALPVPALQITLVAQEDGTREITYTYE